MVSFNYFCLKSLYSMSSLDISFMYAYNGSNLFAKYRWHKALELKVSSVKFDGAFKLGKKLPTETKARYMSKLMLIRGVYPFCISKTG